MKRTELMQEINEMLGVNHNWSRINKLDLERLHEAIKRLHNEARR